MPNLITALNNNCEQLSLYINILKNKCSPGMDSLTFKTVRSVHKFISKPLIHIINQIWAKVPCPFKISIISPVYKSDSKSNISNYQHISAFTTFSKLIEKSQIYVIRLPDNNQQIY